MKSVFWLLSFLWLWGPAPINDKEPVWCQEPLRHGDSVVDAAGRHFVLDGFQLRRFGDPELKKWYPRRRDLPCVLARKLKSQLRRGEDILFRPDQDLEIPTLLKVKGEKGLFLWQSGRIFRLVPDYVPAATRQEFPPTISRLEYDNLEKGGILDRFRERVLATARQKNLARASNIVGKNRLLRGRHPERIYLLHKGKRHRFWSEWALMKRGYRKDQARRVPDRILYAFPFGGYIFD